MLHSTQCCGVLEISGISQRNPMQSLLAIHQSKLYTKGGHVRGAFLTFTAQVEPPMVYGENFKNYILENKLGNVIESSAKNNQRYIEMGEKSHLIKFYIWEVDHDAFDKWYELVYAGLIKTTTTQ